MNTIKERECKGNIKVNKEIKGVSAGWMAYCFQVAERAGKLQFSFLNSAYEHGGKSGLFQRAGNSLLSGVK